MLGAQIGDETDKRLLAFGINEQLGRFAEGEFSVLYSSLLMKVAS